MHLCLIALLLAGWACAVHGGGVSKGTCCPDKWIAFQGSCYYFGHTKLTFADAKRVCQKNHGSHLVYVEGAKENSFIRGHLQHMSSRQSYWLGMTDKEVEGVWKWDGTCKVATFKDWMKGEPNDSKVQDKNNGEDCAEFDYGKAFHWNDAPCSGKRAAPLCEIRGRK